jgi:transcriptional regulator with GAF, ATPase, and Fis domain/pSer/pThr/pTyr-binding forkhead associated (FHA) protein
VTRARPKLDMTQSNTAFLVLKDSDQSGDVHTLRSGTTCAIGRSQKADVIVREQSCSEDHAEIVHSNNAWYVRDLDTQYGTFVNGEAIKADRKLESKDEIRFGKTEYVFVLELSHLPSYGKTASPTLKDGDLDHFRNQPEAPAPSAAYLVTRIEGGFGEVHPLRRGLTYGIGRSPKNRVVLSDDLGSREHAELAYSEKAWFVRDLESLNGTRVNGETVRGERELSSGVELQFGRSKFLFVYELPQLPGIPDTQVRTLNKAIKITGQTSKSRFLLESPEGDDSFTATETSSDRAIAALYRLALDMGSAKTLEELAEAVLSGLFAGLPAEHGAILVVKAGRDLEILAHRSRNEKVRTYHKASQLVSDMALDSREAVLADNVLQDPQYATRDSIRDLRAGSLICSPVTEDEHVIGLIHLYTSVQNQFSQDDLEYALAVARQMAGAWGQIRRQDDLSSTNRELRAALKLDSELVGSSQALKKIEGLISRVANTSATVLIRGESGSGKELVARAIHNNSLRRDSPFVTLNCAAITESLLESELFGHEKGAFTGATEKKAGKFEAADRGTIFLDEIGEMPPSTQAKLLRVLEGHPFERVGGNTQIKVDVRVVAATNRPLEQAVREGQFRPDLFYRLQVVEILVPPLRNRLDDVPALAEHFLKKFTRETGRRIKGFTTAAIHKLQNYTWPGNVRELRNMIERAVALEDKPYLGPAELWPTGIDGTGTGHRPEVTFQPLSLEEFEKRFIQSMLDFTDWNKSRAAELLKIERSTLDRKIKAYELSRSNSPSATGTPTPSPTAARPTQPQTGGDDGLSETNVRDAFPDAGDGSNTDPQTVAEQPTNYEKALLKLSDYLEQLKKHNWVISAASKAMGYKDRQSLSRGFARLVEQYPELRGEFTLKALFEFFPAGKG